MSDRSGRMEKLIQLGQEIDEHVKELGRQEERQRIIKIIEDSVGSMTADVIIQLIKGDNK